MAQLSLRTLFAVPVLTTAFASAALGQQSTAPSDASLFAAREAVWRDYFANGPDLATALPENFIGIGNDSVWSDRAETLAGAKASVARGTRLTELRFPKNAVQRYGNVAIIHSRYEAVLETGGDRWTMRGLITEVFVWDGKRWIHPSWHMNIE
ncbi:MAG TPA: nuclear transport factor 2 family protein [Gemmatimonadales bacterium]